MLRIEAAAYGNRWRSVSPAAKASLAFAGLLAALLTKHPAHNAGHALFFCLLTLWGARVSWRLYGPILFSATAFLLLSSLSLLLSLDIGESGTLTWQWAPSALDTLATLGMRSLAALSALLWLVFTTPLPDLIHLCRRLAVPDVLLDLMVLCYRLLFVLTEVLRDGRIAQAARLGHSRTRLSLRALGLLIANLTLQVWQRAQALHGAAESRNARSTLRFLAPAFAHPRRDMALCGSASLLLLSLVAWSRF